VRLVIFARSQRSENAISLVPLTTSATRSRVVHTVAQLRSGHRVSSTQVQLLPHVYPPLPLPLPSAPDPSGGWPRLLSHPLGISGVCLPVTAGTFVVIRKSSMIQRCLNVSMSRSLDSINNHASASAASARIRCHTDSLSVVLVPGRVVRLGVLEGSRVA
jgi:hypothetical protein